MLFVLKNTYLFLLLLAQSTFTQRFQSRLAVRVLRAYLYAPYHLHLQRNPSELLRNANSEALEIIASVVMPGMILTMELLTVAAILTLLFIAQPAVSLFACVLLGGTALLFMKTLRTRLSRYGEQIQYLPREDGAVGAREPEQREGDEGARARGILSRYLRCRTRTDMWRRIAFGRLRLKLRDSFSRSPRSRGCLEWRPCSRWPASRR